MSEFGLVAYTNTRLYGATRNPWHLERTPGGSSGGAAAAVAGGLVPIASGGDGGGSIRIPAAYTGLVGMKGTFGRIPRGPKARTPVPSRTDGIVFSRRPDGRVTWPGMVLFRLAGRKPLAHRKGLSGLDD